MTNDTTTDNWPQVQAAAKAVLPKAVLAFIDRVLKGPNPQSHLITVLHKVQEVYGYLGPEQLDAVSQLLRVPAAKVTGVANFYHFFRLRPKGRFVISICMGTACYVKGATAIAESLEKALGVKAGQTSKDGLFSLEEARCLGTCGIAPAIMIDGNVHGQLKPEDIPALLAQYRAKA